MYCDKCKYKLSPASEKLQDEYIGCGILLVDRHMQPELTEDDILNDIVASKYAYGWISNGKMMFNNQLLLQNVISCKYCQKR